MPAWKYINHSRLMHKPQVYAAVRGVCELAQECGDWTPEVQRTVTALAIVLDVEAAVPVAPFTITADVAGELANGRNVDLATLDVPGLQGSAPAWFVDALMVWMSERRRVRQ